MVGALDGVGLIQKGIDGAVHFFAVLDLNALLAVDGDAQEHIGALLDVFDVPEEVAKLLGEGLCDRADRLDDAAGAFFHDLNSFTCAAEDGEAYIRALF